MATTYVVLERTGTDGNWHEVNEVEAHSVDQAIRITIDPKGSYIAIPSRKWHYRPGAIEANSA